MEAWEEAQESFANVSFPKNVSHGAMRIQKETRGFVHVLLLPLGIRKTGLSISFGLLIEPWLFKIPNWVLRKLTDWLQDRADSSSHHMVEDQTV